MTLQARLREMPKVELHRHLEGSLRLETLVEYVRQLDLDLPQTPQTLAPLVKIHPSDPPTAANFLSKFRTLRKFYRSEEIIARLTREVIADAAQENLRYLELHFTPVALAQEGRFDLSQVMDWVIGSANQAAKAHGLRLGLIASVNRHEPIKLAETVAEYAVERNEVVGIGLAGDERQKENGGFRSLLREAGQAGLGVCVHAGEWGGSEEVEQAIEGMGATRIGHGVHVLDDPDAVRMAREARAIFEVCLTSNIQSGVAPSLEQHPLPDMIQAGLQVTLNTDDPSISDIQLADEYEHAIQQLGLSEDTVRATVLAAAQASFQSVEFRRELERELEQEFFAFRA